MSDERPFDGPVGIISSPEDLPGPLRHLRWLLMSCFGQDADLLHENENEAVTAHLRKLTRDQMAALLTDIEAALQQSAQLLTNEEQVGLLWYGLGAEIVPPEPSFDCSMRWLALTISEYRAR